jgi:transcriptional regulator with XRE-family HTH domain
VTDDTPHPEGLFASRLDHLFRTVHPHDRGPYTPAEVAAAINAAEGDNVISATYMWQLKTGRRDNPTYKHVIALSRFFGVSPAYFFEEAETERGAIPPEVALALKDDAVRDLALRAAGLSEHSLTAIAGLVDSARALEAPSRQRRARRGPQ